MLDRSFVEGLSKRFTDIRDHLLTLYDLVVQNNFKIVVELGAGQSTYALCAATLATQGDFFSIDLLPDAPLRDFPEGKGILYQYFCYHQIVKDDIEVGKIWERPIDLLFIDSDHEYEHVREVLRVWTPHVRVGGLICLHDTYHTIGHAVRCREALDDFLKENPEIFSVEHNQDCGGFSILKKLKKE